MAKRIEPAPRGFTLIELMIVIAIFALLLMVLLPSMVKSKYQAQWSSCIQSEKTIASALESYNAQEKTYPTDVSVIVTAGYIRALPICATNGSSYGFTAYNTKGVSSFNDSYSIYCNGTHYLMIQDVVQYFPQYNPEIGSRMKSPSQ
jgi:prepilin-type N-terminal cleavage/methylation domain-containing protein